MRIKTIKVSPRFERRYSRLLKRTKQQAQEKERIFRENPFHAILRTHKLSGKDKDAWAFSVNYDYRIKFVFINNWEVLFLDIGTHEIYE